MEEDIHYSTVVFKNTSPAPREKEEDLTVYAEVKHKEAAATPSSGEAAARSHFPVLSVCLGILCVLLVMSISAIIYMSALMNKQKENLRDLKEEIQLLVTERSIFKKEADQLSRVTENFNYTMEVILKFNTFPVNEFCPKKKCQPCQKGWILFQEKCYLFHKGYPWKTWQKSREHCQSTAADLVVVNSPQEQEFISQHIKYYYDSFHGYWLGLHESDNKKWQWVDGRNDSLGYWMTVGSYGPCGLMIPERNLTASWDPAKCNFMNKFICEGEVLIRSD
ncbi:C-type lectin domain family 4 member C-like [Notolabrus celidotus]|uniref:C-type lectin domain family 4 member C-like n=1 Tax=Notolabrus celidotus TaxID=1203425 RepID=UPI00148F88B6|nr:C-type lectin domain family 4 member C-like [Notolabrus celidotus]